MASIKGIAVEYAEEQGRDNKNMPLHNGGVARRDWQVLYLQRQSRTEGAREV